MIRIRLVSRSDLCLVRLAAERIVNTGSVVATIVAISVLVSRGLIGTAMAPASQMPNNVANVRPSDAASTATRSPICTPRPASSLARSVANRRRSPAVRSAVVVRAIVALSAAAVGPKTSAVRSSGRLGSMDERAFTTLNCSVEAQSEAMRRPILRLQAQPIVVGNVSFASDGDGDPATP